jgi:hypothetical protein
MVLVAVIGSAVRETEGAQDALQPFYTPPNPLPGPPGTVIRQEPLGVSIPDSPAPAGGRPVVAWAHGTLGMGNACVPSRSANPLQDTDNWLDQMMLLGWVVVSTDYVGLGTPGPNLYLVAQSEVRDIVNSVRAVRSIPQAHAGSRYVTWGHSQGGHSSIWTGHLGKEYAPELALLGVAAAAPALELPDIMGAQWDNVVGWVIGPDVIESWPRYYPKLTTTGLLTPEAQDSWHRLATECIKESGLEGQLRQTLGQDFFAVDPLTLPPWADAAQDQTPPPLPADMPAFIAQGTADTVVLPWPNAIVQEEWCSAGSSLSMLWMGGINHFPAATTAGPMAVAWIADRFAGRPAPRTCDVPPPVPASSP